MATEHARTLKPARAVCRWLRAHLGGGEAGDAGVATGAVLVAVVVSGTVVATTTLDLGSEGANAYENTAHEAISAVSSTLYPRGGVVAEDSDGDGAAERVSVALALAPGGESTAIAGDEGSQLVTGYSDSSAHEAAAAHTVRWLRGEGPSIDEGELVEVEVALPAGVTIEAGEQFRVEIIGPAGGTLVIERRAPLVVTSVMFLH